MAKGVEDSECFLVLLKFNENCKIDYNDLENNCCLLRFNKIWNRVLQANGIQNFRYSTRLNNNQLRFSKRQDLLTKSRFLMWKPALNPGHIYPNIKKPAFSLNFNRYGIQPPPIVAPIHQSYLLAIPTKVNYASYRPLKEIEEKRNPRNLHHVTIINAIMPKPYLSTSPTHSHPSTNFHNYRTNNNQLYHKYFNNFGRQNMENLNQINAQQLQLQEQQDQLLQLVYPSSSTVLNIHKPTIDHFNVPNYDTKNNEIAHVGLELNSPVSQCGRRTRDDTNKSGSDVLYYYCNNRITNYKNPTQQQIISIHSTISTSPSTTTTTTTTTTTEAPSTTQTKSSTIDFNSLTTERPIFLPTPNTPYDNSFIPITSTMILKNSITDSGNGEYLKQQRQKKHRHASQALSRYEDINRQQNYTTAASYDSMKLHSFFTIEDAVTRAPEMQVFNDPYQAYRHARRQQINQQRHIISTTKIPDTTTTTTKSKLKNVFDNLDDEDYSLTYNHARRQQTDQKQQNMSVTKLHDTTTTTTKSKFKSFFDDLVDEDYSHANRHGKRRKGQRQILTTTKIPDTITTAGKSRPTSFFDDLDEDYSHAYRNVRNQRINHQRQSPTANKIPEMTTNTTKATFKSFFDDLDDEDYAIPEADQYDYSLFNNPQKFDYQKSEYKNQHPQHNQIIDHTHKATKGNAFTAVDETFLDKPKSIAPTSYALPVVTVTTYNPKQNFLTTHKMPFLPSYKSKPVTFTTPFDTVLENQETVIGNENNTLFPNDVRTTTNIPITTTTEKKPTGNTIKSASRLRSSTAFNFPKQRKLHKPYKNLTTTTTKATTTLKKVPKYQRRYKTKKLKQFKHLYTTTSTTTTSTTTTAIPTTAEIHTTRRATVRMLPITSTNEEPTTKKAVSSRIYSTTEVPKQKNRRYQSLSTEATKRNNIKARTSISSTVTINNSTAKVHSARRGSKRTKVAKSESKTTQVASAKLNSKSRRRLTSSRTTVKPSIIRTASALISTSTLSSTPIPAVSRTSTTTTMKSIMRISNNKSRTKLLDDKRSQKKDSEISDDRQDVDGRVSLKSITSTMADIPPLPIEIYFKKIHNPKM